MEDDELSVGEMARIILAAQMAELDRRLGLAAVIKRACGDFPCLDFWGDQQYQEETDKGEATGEALRQWRAKLRKAGMKG